MILAKESLVIKRKVLEKFTKGNLYPYTKHYLRKVMERFGEYWKNHFSTIGLVGMNEACLNLIRKDIGDDTGQAFSKKVLDFMRDKRISEVDDELYYAIDERSNVVDLQEKGRKLLSPQDQKLFTMQDLSEGLQEIDSDSSLAQEEKAKKRERFYREYGEKSEKLHNISQLLKA